MSPAFPITHKVVGNAGKNKLMHCKNCDDTGRIYESDFGDDTNVAFCVCEEGARLSFFAWFAEEKKKLVTKMTYA